MKVTIEVIQGSTAGKKYVYDGCNSIYLGRQSDCGIVFPEMTVSRYHCLLKISLNEVTLQDLGSSNGTYLNNIKIGHGDRKKSQVEADDDKNEEYILRNGDEIRLGKSCMLKCMIEIGELSKEDGTDTSFPP